MGLFSKKECSICGGDAGRIFTKKLEDGVLCKDCVSKLSPWFSDRRSSTVAEIAGQLEYRAANAEKVAEFQPTRTYDGRYKILIDDNARRFCVARENSWRDSNPDIFEFSDITGCSYEIRVSKTDVTPKEDANAQTAQSQTATNAVGAAATAVSQANQQAAFAAQQAQQQAMIAAQQAQQQAALAAQQGNQQAAFAAQQQAFAAQQQAAAFAAQQQAAFAAQQQAFAAQQGNPQAAMFGNPQFGFGTPVGNPQAGMFGVTPGGIVAPYGDPKFLDPKYRMEADGKIYTYDYDFIMTINVNNPYFLEMKYQVNDKTIDLEYGEEYQNCLQQCELIKAALLQASAGLV